MIKTSLTIIALAMLAGCATPVSYTNAPFTTYDRDTEFAIEEKSDGFDITVNYSRYQFIPESTVVALACKSALTTIAYEAAEKRKRKIAPINDQQIKISTGRNLINGVTTCSANTSAKWEK